MSEQRDVTQAGGGTRPITIAEQRAAALEAQAIQEAAGKKRAEKKARIARVLERGWTVDRLAVDLPKDLHGEWVALDQVERWETLGFWVDKDHAYKRQLHPATNDAVTPGPARVGDVVFMTCTQEDFEIMQEVKQEMYVERHGSPTDKKRLRQEEEKEYKNLVENDIGLPVVDEGKEVPVGKTGIEEGIEATKQRIANANPAPAGLAEIGKR